MNARKKTPNREKNSVQGQAPKLIKEIKRRFGVTQPQLSPVLGISQQAVSEYEAGHVTKERYDVIKKLQDILEGKISLSTEQKRPAQDLSSLTAEELIYEAKEVGEGTRDHATVSTDGAQTRRVGNLSTGGIEGSKDAKRVKG